jgi:hypothetical protein
MEPAVKNIIEMVNRAEEAKVNNNEAPRYAKVNFERDHYSLMIKGN